MHQDVCSLAHGRKANLILPHVFRRRARHRHNSAIRAVLRYAPCLLRCHPRRPRPRRRLRLRHRRHLLPGRARRPRGALAYAARMPEARRGHVADGCASSCAQLGGDGRPRCTTSSGPSTATTSASSTWRDGGGRRGHLLRRALHEREVRPAHRTWAAGAATTTSRARRRSPAGYPSEWSEFPELGVRTCWGTCSPARSPSSSSSSSPIDKNAAAGGPAINNV
jgi:hypothetical protein